MSSNPLILVLKPDNPCNTTIVKSETNEVVYTVVTTHEKESTTYLKDADGTSVAHWEWRDVRSDILTLGNAKPMSASTWLQKSMIPFSSSVTFENHNKRKFKWTGVGSGSEMRLFSASSKNAIVTFQKSLKWMDRKVDPPAPMHRDATLTLSGEAEDIMNLVVVSFLMLEKTRRISETSMVTRASSLGVAPRVF